MSDVAEHLALRTFGGLSVTRAGAPVIGPGAQRNRLALLAVLAAAGPGGVPRDRLLALFWPENDMDRARHSLKQAVYALRRELGEDTIQGTASLALNSEVVDADVRAFDLAIAREDFAAAAALYTGPFLDGVYLRENVEFEEWTAGERARLAHLWTNAVERLAAEAESRGAWREAAGWWRQLAAADMLSGRNACNLVRTLAEAGDTAAALQHAYIHETVVRETLDRAPDAELVELVTAVREGAWSRTPSQAVAIIPLETMDVAEVPPEPDVAASQVPSLAVRPDSRWFKRSVMAAMVALVLFGGTVIAAVYRTTTPRSRDLLMTFLTRSAPKLDDSLIVVVPFVNRTRDSTLDMLGERIADWVGTQLSEHDQSVVMPLMARANAQIVEHIPSLMRARDPAIAAAEESGAGIAVIGEIFPGRDRNHVAVSVRIWNVRTRTVKRTVDTFIGVVPDSADALIVAIANRTMAELAASRSSASLGEITASMTKPPSDEAFERVAHAWNEFFQNPWDTVTVFAELERARASDSTYAAPLLMRGYILDVKRVWPGVAATVRQLTPLLPHLTRAERVFYDLLQHDLAGEPYQRVSSAKMLARRMPAATEMAFLVAFSELYVGHPRAAKVALMSVDPNRGMGLFSPSYWEWRAEIQHELGEREAERTCVDSGMHRFSSSRGVNESRIRLLGSGGDVAGLFQAIDHNTIDDTTSPAGLRQELRLLAARELRAHGFDAAAQQFIDSAVAEARRPQQAATSTSAMRRQADAFYEARRFADARIIYATLARMVPGDVNVQGRLGTIAVQLGDTIEANRIDRELASLQRPYLFGYHIAWRAHMAALRDPAHPQATLALLRQALRQGFRFMDVADYTVHLDPDFEALRKTDAYREFLASLERINGASSEPPER